MIIKSRQKLFFYFLFLSFIIFGANDFIFAQELSKIEVTTIDQFQKVAPGESLPVSMKLFNMGGSGRVDVEITYRIEDAQKNVLSEELETVAVETTASFIKQVKIPPDLKPGKYFILADMKYPDQKVPAVSRMPFQIEYKYFGFFRDQLIILAAIVIGCIILILLVAYFINKRRKIVVSQFEYKNAPPPLKPYFELISDIILTMRLHLGDKALAIANSIIGLKVADNGEVLAIDKEPMEIVTLLTMQYEKNLGYKGINLSQKALATRQNSTKLIEDKIEYQKTAKLLDDVHKYFVKK
ncbi:MAG: hypothetical protein A2Y82_01920 [Candidatus Buchananbacteria bacterium RBG_13_36_9]|uniref:CARDB domain-containing protein n=1 Tax=Candidatus Buchananbacteria bacterium RBG_13_36_9 TaxID=1797530 RepID=A0A1G1XMH9_9BACT|nr:MAG: hypothetical protein A2Y82_01920 [Candidatus Buchananbacteria bacterium RBG_13_36_9]